MFLFYSGGALDVVDYPGLILQHIPCCTDVLGSDVLGTVAHKYKPAAVYSVTVMTHVKALQAGHSSQGTSEPITPALPTGVYKYLKHDCTVPTCFNQSKVSISFDYIA